MENEKIFNSVNLVGCVVKSGKTLNGKTWCLIGLEDIHGATVKGTLNMVMCSKNIDTKFVISKKLSIFKCAVSTRKYGDNYKNTLNVFEVIPIE